ncbi:MAG: glucosaminidase domain-containing protein [Bacteroidaceae bacterium]|nr:glucosaminidase domain-containing protein [Bacteroidaceae bacterium]
MKRLLVYLVCTLLLAMVASPVCAATTQDKYEAYIARYYKLAQEQQRLHGIPASITLAQGLLESAAGQSKLAVVARNHFGVKCHNWEGDAVKYKGDCYRMYEDVAESYEDHSTFLLQSRYASLFELKITDYKGWAKGLRKCGYAEDPKYPEKLITIIEKYDLQRYVKGGKKRKTVEIEEPEIVLLRDVYMAWGLLYVLAEEGDTYDRIAADTGFDARDLAKYNEHSRKTVLHSGDIVYLEKKKKKADKGYDKHTVVEGETFRSISQLYGIDTKRLARRNKMRYNDALQEGQVIVLR